MASILENTYSFDSLPIISIFPPDEIHLSHTHLLYEFLKIVKYVKTEIGTLFSTIFLYKAPGYP